MLCCGGCNVIYNETLPLTFFLVSYHIIIILPFVTYDDDNHYHHLIVIMILHFISFHFISNHNNHILANDNDYDYDNDYANDYANDNDNN